MNNVTYHVQEKNPVGFVIYFPLYAEEKAWAHLDWMRKAHPETEFRLIKRTVTEEVIG